MRLPLNFRDATIGLLGFSVVVEETATSLTVGRALVIEETTTTATTGTKIFRKINNGFEVVNSSFCVTYQVLKVVEEVVQVVTEVLVVVDVLVATMRVKVVNQERPSASSLAYTMEMVSTKNMQTIAMRILNCYCLSKKMSSLWQVCLKRLGDVI